MDATRIVSKPKGPLVAFIVVTTIALLAVTGLDLAAQASGEQTFVNLSPGPGAPLASGGATIELVGGVAVGDVQVNNLPPQPFGSGHFYGVWFVRADTGDKAFLGALIGQDSIIFSTGGNGEIKFAATRFTTPNAPSSIAFGPAGTNVIIVLIETMINGLTPSPISGPPGTEVAVVGTF